MPPLRATHPCPTNPQTLNFPAGDIAHLNMTPAQFFDPVLKSWTIFVWGANWQLRKWAVSSTGSLTYIGQSHEYASADVRGTPPGGMPGGFCSGSDLDGATGNTREDAASGRTGIHNHRILRIDNEIPNSATDVPWTERLPCSECWRGSRGCFLAGMQPAGLISRALTGRPLVHGDSERGTLKKLTTSRSVLVIPVRRL